MRRSLLLLVVGLAGAATQGGFAALVPAFLLPDATLLLVVAAAGLVGPAEGLLLAAALGLSADALSGALLGQQAFLRVLELGFTRAVAAQLDLRRAAPLAAFVFGLSLADAVGMGWILRLFQGSLHLQPGLAAELVARAAVNAVAAPVVSGFARAGLARLDASMARREMRLETHRPSL